MGDGYFPTPVRLKAIHILVDGENIDPKFEVLCGFDRIKGLLENLYRPQYLHGQSMQGDSMRLAGEIAKKSVIVSVTRRCDPEAIEGMASFLESSWRDRFGVSPIQEMK